MAGEGHPKDGHAANEQAAVATPRQLSRLERVVLEIVETEQAYVRDLKSIVEVRTLLFRLVMSQGSSSERKVHCIYVIALYK